MTYIDPIQAEINRRLGISSETFLKYSPAPQNKTPASSRTGTLAALVGLDPVQQAVNRQLGISDETFLKYAIRS